MEKSAPRRKTAVCTRSRTRSQIPKPPTTVAKGIEKFTNDLFKRVAKETEGNFVISGLSAHMALTLCAMGARGDTADQMHKVLHHPQSNIYVNYNELIESLNDSDKATIGIMTKICTDNSIVVKKNFKKDVISLFNSEVEEVDFLSDTEEVVKSVNDSCAKATANKIKEIISIDDIKENTKLVLVNAIYFKAQWFKMFHPTSTVPRPFHIDEKITVDVLTMESAVRVGYKDLKHVDAKCVALPYEDTDFLFIVIRPNEIDGLEALEANIKNVHFNYKEDFDQNSNSHSILLYLPKFEIESKVTMTDHLQNLGMVQAFSTSGDFKGISEKPTLVPPLHIDNVIQKVIIEVDERGTEAAAATRVPMSGGGGPPPFKFFVDRPFLYRIVNVRNNLTLFSGRVVKPEYTTKKDVFFLYKFL